MKEIKQIIVNINSEDSTTSRSAIEELFSEELDNEIISLLCEKLVVKDSGIRDAVSQVLINNQSQGISKVLTPYIASEDIVVRNLAGEILLRRGLSSVDALVDYLPNGNDDDKKFIIDILGLIGESRVERVVVKTLLETANDNLILACIECLGNIKAENCFYEISNFYEKNELYKPTIVEALGKIESEKALEFILGKYIYEDVLTKFSMMETLGKIGNEETFFLLLSELKVAAPPLNWAIIESLKSLRDKLQIDIPFDESSKNSLLNTLKEGEINYKKAASYLITYFLDRDIIDVCLDIYGDDFEIDDNIRINYNQESLPFFNQLAGHLQSEAKNLRLILELTKDVLEEDSYQQIRNLNDLAYHNICDALTELLSNPDEEVRRISMELLFKLNNPVALMFMDVMVSDINLWNKLRLLDLIEDQTDTEVLAALKTLMNDEDEMVRERATGIYQQKESALIN